MAIPVPLGKVPPVLTMDPVAVAVTTVAVPVGSLAAVVVPLMWVDLVSR